MPDHKQEKTSNGMICNEFDALLADMMDGVLTGAKLEGFRAHAQVCSNCGALFVEAEAGRNWLKSLTEVEPPAGLVENVLASTTGIASGRLGSAVLTTQPRVSWLERVQAWAMGIAEPVWGTIRQPRFAMSFGMAFFALSVGLTVLGVKPADVRQISLRPTALRHSYNMTQARVVRYYENIRFVYEVESRVREFRRNMTPAEPSPVKTKEHKNDTSKEPEQKQERNYSETEDRLVLAGASVSPSVDLLRGKLLEDNDLPVVPVTTYRRFV
ncbi:MAG: hypothetical protein WAO10_11070 [Candidatus Sulfotelmatobacter sp.]